MYDFSSINARGLTFGFIDTMIIQPVLGKPTHDFLQPWDHLHSGQSISKQFTGAIAAFQSFINPRNSVPQLMNNALFFAIVAINPCGPIP